MPLRIRARVTGIDSLIARLNAIKRGFRTTVLRRAMTAGGSVIRKDADKRVPVRTGQLKKSLGFKVVTYKSGVVVAVIGPRLGYKVSVPVSRRGQMGTANIDPARYAHLAERGRKEVRIKQAKVLAGRVFGKGRGSKGKKFGPFTVGKRKGGPKFLGWQTYGTRSRASKKFFFMERAHIYTASAVRWKVSDAIQKGLRNLATRGRP